MAKEMKDSGISYFGDIPKHWEMKKNGYLFTCSKQIVMPGIEYQLLSLTTNGVKEKDINSIGGKVPENYNGYQIVKPDDMVMCLFDIDCSAVFSGLSHFHGMISPAYKILRCSSNILPNYAEYIFRYIGGQRLYKQYSKNLRYTLNIDDFMALKLPLPPISEQKAIADFLDTKCGEIDGLLADLDAEVKTLAEYKKSLIAETVTRGLNPNAPMKQSGIPWADTIPSHWKIQKGKYTFTLLQRPVKEDDGVITCFRDGEVTLRSNRREDGFTMSEKEYGYQGIEPGDLVVHGMDGFAGSIGISDSRGKGTPVLNVLDSDQNKRYLMYYLRNMAYGNVFLAMSTGIRVRSCDLSWKKLGDIRIVLPPIEEQEAITAFLDQKLEAIQEAITTKQYQIEKLKAYKASLIYEYVTGKKQVAL